MLPRVAFGFPRESPGGEGAVENEVDGVAGQDIEFVRSGIDGSAVGHIGFPEKPVGGCG